MTLFFVLQYVYHSEHKIPRQKITPKRLGFEAEYPKRNSTLNLLPDPFHHFARNRKSCVKLVVRTCIRKRRSVSGFVGSMGQSFWINLVSLSTSLFEQNEVFIAIE